MTLFWQNHRAGFFQRIHIGEICRTHQPEFFTVVTGRVLLQRRVQPFERRTISRWRRTPMPWFLATVHSQCNSLSIFSRVSLLNPACFSGNNSAMISGRRTHSRNSFSCCALEVARSQSSASRSSCSRAAA